MITFDVANETWRVRRRWLPWRRRIREVPDAGPSLSGDLGDDPFSLIIGLLLLVLAIPAFVVIALLVLELALLLLLLPVIVLVRLALPVPWTIEVLVRPSSRRVLGWHERAETRVAGWRASREAMREIRRRIERGERPVPAEDDTRRPRGAVPPGGPGADDAPPPRSGSPAGLGREATDGPRLPGVPGD